jgi:hypothetical protein
MCGLIEPPFTWSIAEGELRMWRGRQFLGAIPRDRFPQIIEGMARELMRDRQDVLNDPKVPLE